jgi:hypothetical protein
MISYHGPTDNKTTFIIADNSSQIASVLPHNFIEPLVILAKIEGYKGIDDYVIHLIKDRLEMFTDTRDELGEEFQKYMQDIIIGPDTSSSTSTTTSTNKEQREEEEEEEEEDIEL